MRRITPSRREQLVLHLPGGALPGDEGAVHGGAEAALRVLARKEDPRGAVGVRERRLKPLERCGGLARA